ncbi:hypothetical protein K488DRAFT_82782 [Vararia minispora EC-137]|uniref:Uncharacterized protein n=1 Tax=Vararia minispora EC-137 TaxID=1314806 RepID=A0ACB8QVN3_9AGAM|nr:hypothetical protein K488DRAFT_82782 [Vararia minispora EC-137]
MHVDQRKPAPRKPSPDPILIKKKWELRRGYTAQRDPADRMLENERKEHASYVAAMSAYHQKNPGMMAADLRRKLRQCAHELVITQLDANAAEKRRIAAEALFEKVKSGTLGEGLLTAPASPTTVDSDV